jgi:hypothetical protein
MVQEEPPRALFASLVDDAGLFPPTALSMADALARHAADLEEASPVLTHRLVCPADRLGELSSLLDGEIDLLLLGPLDDGLAAFLEAVAADERLSLRGIEGVVSETTGTLRTEVPVYAEVPVRGEWGALLSKAVDLGFSAKVRCGGMREELFPTADELGRFIHRCAAQAVAFKATAGLHHALPYTEESTGFHHHGYLNLLLAAVRAVDGATAAETAAALELEDADAVTDELARVGDDLASRARALFVSYGSCSTREPLSDLARLGLIDAGAAAR